MNIKITGNSITWKISEQEMNRLLEKKELTETVTIARAGFTMKIEPAEEGEELFPTLSAHGDDAILTLLAPAAEIRKLADIGKNRDGLSVDCNGLDIRLQVDLRSDSRPRRKGG